MKSTATTVEEYLDELPEERRQVITAVRDTIVRNLPAGYRECLAFGMIGYVIPLETYPETYNRQPLSYAALAAQKNHYALYLSCAYSDPHALEELRTAFEKAGKKLDIGKSCVRFKKLDDLPLDVIAKAIASVPPARFIEIYETARKR